MYIIGRIDVTKYRCITQDITADEVILTEERVRHIEDHHPGHFEAIRPFLSIAIEDPDYILQDTENTGLILKLIETQDLRLQIVLRLHTSQDASNYKNSIISSWLISRSRWQNYLRNKIILYSRE